MTMIFNTIMVFIFISITTLNAISSDVNQCQVITRIMLTSSRIVVKKCADTVITGDKINIYSVLDYEVVCSGEVLNIYSDEYFAIVDDKCIRLISDNNSFAISSNIKPEYVRSYMLKKRDKQEILKIDHFVAFNKLPEKTFLTYKERLFDVCFKCHVSDKILDVHDIKTGFRNIDNNLHYIHINGSKSVNCKACHDVDSSGNVEYAKEYSDDTTWKRKYRTGIMPQSPDGGKCNPGCHKEKDYNKTTRINNR